MKVILISIELNQTSEAAGDPPATYRNHIFISISRGRRHRNGKKVEEVSTFLSCLRWIAGGSTTVEIFFVVSIALIVALIFSVFPLSRLCYRLYGLSSALLTKNKMSGKGRRAYNHAPTKEKLREWGSLSRKGDKIKFVDVRFRRWQIVGFRESSEWQWFPQLRSSRNERWFVR